MAKRFVFRNPEQLKAIVENGARKTLRGASDCRERPASWKVGREADCTGLLNRRTGKPFRGFDSLTFRQCSVDTA